MMFRSLPRTVKPLPIQAWGPSWSLSTTARLYSTRTAIRNNFLRVSDEVRDAVACKRPVVALETTIYTHGFPFPDNVQLAAELERLTRENGAVPAHIGFLNGQALVGMSESEMTTLLEKASEGHETVKLSRRDLGYIAGQGQLGKPINGGTTIAGTMVLAHLAGIQVFATGGLGGVHKGGEVSMDVSADLTELGRTPVALISSGCKSFLDVPRTLEYLETQGVGVGTFADGREGQVDFPAFWTRESGSPSPRTIKSEEEAAAIIYAQSQLGIQSGLLFANPIAAGFSLEKEYMDTVMAQAVQDAKVAGVTGHANTPYVLSRIRDITGGATVQANRELVFSNVVRGARVAREVARLQTEDRATSGADPISAASKNQAPVILQQRKPSTDSSQQNQQLEVVCSLSERPELIVVGSVAIDLACDLQKGQKSWGLDTSTPASMFETIGGVGRNIAVAASLAGARTMLVSQVGNDLAGRSVQQQLSEHSGLQLGLSVRSDFPTARYIAFNTSDGSLFAAASNFDIFDNYDVSALYESQPGAFRPHWIALDANCPVAALQAWIQARLAEKVAFEPVSQAKSVRIIEALRNLWLSEGVRYHVDLITPNTAECASMTQALLNYAAGSSWSLRVSIKDCTELGSSLPDDFERALLLLNVSRCVMLTLGPQGIFVAKVLTQEDSLLVDPGQKQYIHHHTLHAADGNGEDVLVYLRHFAASHVSQKDIVSVNGAGDTFTGAVLAGLSQSSPLPEGELVPVAQEASAKTLQSRDSVARSVKELAPSLRRASVHKREGQ